MTLSGTRGVLNDALSIYFADATLASAFVVRWCIGTKVETAGGVEPEPRVGRGCIGHPEGREPCRLTGSNRQKRTPARGMTPGLRAGGRRWGIVSSRLDHQNSKR
jgi:hypothetical protein